MNLNLYTFNLEGAAEALMFSIRLTCSVGTAPPLNVNEIAARFGWDESTTRRICDYLVSEELLRPIDPFTMTLTHSGRAWLRMARLARADARPQPADATHSVLATTE
jgi:hypothetical protein